MVDTSRSHATDDDGDPGVHGGTMFDALGGFTRMWSEFAMKMMSAGMAATPGSPPPQAAREIRSAMFRAMSEQCEQFMRSPAFLDMMKQSLGAAVELRTQLNEFLNRVHHEMQSVSRNDVDTIMLTIRHLESRVLDRLEQLEQRLEALAGPTSGAASGTGARPRPAAGPKSRSARSRRR